MNDNTGFNIAVLGIFWTGLGSLGFWGWGYEPQTAVLYGVLAYLGLFFVSCALQVAAAALK